MSSHDDVVQREHFEDVHHIESDSAMDTSITVNLLPTRMLDIEVDFGHEPVSAELVGPDYVIDMLTGMPVATAFVHMPDHPPGKTLPPGSNVALDTKRFTGKAPRVGMYVYRAAKQRHRHGACFGKVIRVSVTAGTFETNQKITVTHGMAVVFYEGGVAHGQELKTNLSPLTQLTLPVEKRASIGIPESAEFVAFFYPVVGLEKGLESLHFGEDDAWAFLLLSGGFCYFDEHKKLMRTNACAMVASPLSLTFRGPHPASDEAVAVMKAQGRMCPTTLDALQADGFRSFGWVSGGELLGDTSVSLTLASYKDKLRKHPEIFAYNNGAFLYGMRKEEEKEMHYVYYALDSSASTQEVACPVATGLQRSMQDLGRQFDIYIDREEHERAKSEHLQMKEMVGSGLSVKDMSDAAIWFYMMVIPLGLGAASTLGPLFLAALAYGSRVAFEILSVAYYSALTAYMLWQVVVSTSMLSQRAHDRLRYSLVGVCLFVTIMAGASAYWQNFMVVHVRASGEYVALLIFGLGVPLALRLANHQAAKLLEKRWHQSHHMVHDKQVQKAKSARHFNADGLKAANAQPEQVELQTVSTPSAQSPPPSPPSPPEIAHAAAQAATQGALEQHALSSIESSRQAVVEALEVHVVPNNHQPLEIMSKKSLTEGPDDLEQARAAAKAEAAALVAAAETARQKISSEKITFASGGGRASGRISNATEQSPTPDQLCAVAPEKPKRKIAQRRSDGLIKFDGGMHVACLGNHDCDCRCCVNPHGEYAAIAIQVFARRYLSYLARRRRLTAFEWPILYACVFYMIGMALLHHIEASVMRDSDLYGNWSLFGYHFGWFFLALPCVGVLGYDAFVRQPIPQFSLTHAVFYVSVLYSLTGAIASCDVFLLNRITDLFGTTEPFATAAPLVAYGLHVAFASGCQVLGLFCIKFVASPNTHAHFVFPIQAFIYLMEKVLYNLIKMTEAVTVTWIFQQILMQSVTIIIASGTFKAISLRSMELFFSFIFKKQPLLGSDPSNDPIFKLQFIAALGVQYDIAIYTSVIMVPTLVSFFVWRDGYFTIEGVESIVYVTSCNLENMWIRFTILAGLQFLSLSLARALLARQMRLALLGKKTVHGVSSLASEIAGARALRKGISAQKVVNDRLERSRLWTKALGSFSSAADRDDLRRELSLTNLHHPTIYFRRVRSNYIFYIVCLSFQLYACFRLRRTAPATWDDQSTLTPNRTRFTQSGGALRPLPLGFGPDAPVGEGKGSGMANETTPPAPPPEVEFLSLPKYMRMIYVGPDYAPWEYANNCTEYGWAYDDADVD